MVSIPQVAGCFTATVEPCERLSEIDLTERGEIIRRSVLAIVANLSPAIARREIDTVAHLLNWEKECMQIVETRNSVGPGNVVLIAVETSTGMTELFCGFGQLGASAESVARRPPRKHSLTSRLRPRSENIWSTNFCCRLLWPVAECSPLRN